jgi:putative ATPase
VFVLQPIPADAVRTLVRRALDDRDRGLGARRLSLEPDALDLIASECDGDARRALATLEAAAEFVGDGGRITAAIAREAMQLRVARFDKGGEETYNMLSAFHKSLRGSDPQGALYWAARFVDGGGDPMILFRRAIAMAAEDIGLADPNALVHAVAARDAYHTLGAPEGLLPLVQMIVYLATAPKSNKVVVALGDAMAAARETPTAGVPMHIRNAPTNLMRELGYNAGYQYAHDAPEAYLPQEYLPDALRGRVFYTPGPFGFEKEIARRLAWWSELKARGTGSASE